MTDARERILAAIRRSTGGAGDPATARAAAVGAPVKPNWRGSSLERFRARLEASAGSHAVIHNLQELPAAAASFLRAHELPLRLVLGDASLDSLAWGSEWELLGADAARTDGTSTLVRAYAALAETGSVATRSGKDFASSLNFLPDHHLVLLDADAILDHFEDLWARLHADGLPRTVNLITGPSRTADIEQTIQLGAHGPRQLHVIILDPAG